MRQRLQLALGVVLLLAAVGSGTPAEAHEPVFSLGPETIYEGGLGIETGFHFEDAAGQQLAVMSYELLYGVRENLSLTLHIPQIIRRQENDESSDGLGDIETRVKYRFFKKDMLGAQHKISGIFGVKVPTGDHDANPALGTGTTDILFGGSYGYESRTWYHFLTGRYRLRTESGRRNPGDRVFIDGALGYRPWRREYLERDFVSLLEANAEFEFKDALKGTRLPNTGGDTVWLGPTGLLSYRNIMFKGGVQFPVYEDLNGNQDGSKVRAVFAIEYHF